MYKDRDLKPYFSDFFSRNDFSKQRKINIKQAFANANAGRTLVKTKSKHFSSKYSLRKEPPYASRIERFMLTMINKNCCLT